MIKNIQSFSEKYFDYKLLEITERYGNFAGHYCDIVDVLFENGRTPISKAEFTLDSCKYVEGSSKNLYEIVDLSYDWQTYNASHSDKEQKIKLATRYRDLTLRELDLLFDSTYSFREIITFFDLEEKQQLLETIKEKIAHIDELQNMIFYALLEDVKTLEDERSIERALRSQQGVFAKTINNISKELDYYLATVFNGDDKILKETTPQVAVDTVRQILQEAKERLLFICDKLIYELDQKTIFNQEK